MILEIVTFFVTYLFAEINKNYHYNFLGIIFTFVMTKVFCLFLFNDFFYSDLIDERRFIIFIWKSIDCDLRVHITMSRHALILLLRQILKRQCVICHQKLKLLNVKAKGMW